MISFFCSRMDGLELLFLHITIPFAHINSTSMSQNISISEQLEMQIKTFFYAFLTGSQFSLTLFFFFFFPWALQ